MSKIVRIFVAGEYACLEDVVNELGGASLIEAAFPEGEWKSITLRDAKYKYQKEIIAKSIVRDEQLGFRQDVTLLPEVRAKVMIEAWDFGGEVGDIGELTALQANIIDGIILAHLTPNMFATPDFMKAWNDKRPSSEASDPKAPHLFIGKTSIPA